MNRLVYQYTFGTTQYRIVETPDNNYLFEYSNETDSLDVLIWKRVLDRGELDNYFVVEGLIRELVRGQNNIQPSN